MLLSDIAFLSIVNIRWINVKKIRKCISIIQQRLSTDLSIIFLQS